MTFKLPDKLPDGPMITVEFRWPAAVAVSVPASPSSRRNQPLWSDEFDSDQPMSGPNPSNWAYDVGSNGWGNKELEDYCEFDSNVSPCSADKPNSFVSGGFLHIVARKDEGGNYTSARLSTLGLRSFQYGRIESCRRGEGSGRRFG